jgi:hypothetical protein
VVVVVVDVVVVVLKEGLLGDVEDSFRANYELTWSMMRLSWLRW